MFGSPNYSYGYNWMPSMSQTVPQTQQNQQMQTGSNIAWCQGEAGAKSYTVGAGQTMWLLDSENDGVFYIKTVDASGMPMPLRSVRHDAKIQRIQTEFYWRSETDCGTAFAVWKDESATVSAIIPNGK